MEESNFVGINITIKKKKEGHEVSIIQDKIGIKYTTNIIYRDFDGKEIIDNSKKCAHSFHLTSSSKKSFDDSLVKAIYGLIKMKKNSKFI